VQKVPADRRHNHRRQKGRPDDDADVRVGESLLLADDREEGRHQGEADGAEEEQEAEDHHVQTASEGIRAAAPPSGQSSVDNRVFVRCKIK